MFLLITTKEEHSELTNTYKVVKYYLNEFYYK